MEVQLVPVSNLGSVCGIPNIRTNSLNINNSEFPCDLLHETNNSIQDITNIALAGLLPALTTGKDATLILHSIPKEGGVLISIAEQAMTTACEEILNLVHEASDAFPEDEMSCTVLLSCFTMGADSDEYLQDALTAAMEGTSLVSPNPSMGLLLSPRAKDIMESTKRLRSGMLSPNGGNTLLTSENPSTVLSPLRGNSSGDKFEGTPNHGVSVSNALSVITNTVKKGNMGLYELAIGSEMFKSPSTTSKPAFVQTPSEKCLTIRDDPSGNVVVTGVMEVQCETPDDVGEICTAARCAIFGPSFSPDYSTSDMKSPGFQLPLRTANDCEVSWPLNIRCHVIHQLTIIQRSLDRQATALNKVKTYTESTSRLRCISLCPITSSKSQGVEKKLPKWISALSTVLNKMQSQAPSIPMSSSRLTTILRPSLLARALTETDTSSSQICPSTFLSILPSDPKVAFISASFASRVRRACESVANRPVASASHRSNGSVVNDTITISDPPVLAYGSRSSPQKGHTSSVTRSPSQISGTNKKHDDSYSVESKVNENDWQKYISASIRGVLASVAEMAESEGISHSALGSSNPTTITFSEDGVDVKYSSPKKSRFATSEQEAEDLVTLEAFKAYAESELYSKAVKSNSVLMSRSPTSKGTESRRSDRKNSLDTEALLSHRSTISDILNSSRNLRESSSMSPIANGAKSHSEERQSENLFNSISNFVSDPNSISNINFVVSPEKKHTMSRPLNGSVSVQDVASLNQDSMNGIPDSDFRSTVEKLEKTKNEISFSLQRIDELQKASRDKNVNHPLQRPPINGLSPSTMKPESNSGLPNGLSIQDANRSSEPLNSTESARRNFSVNAVYTGSTRRNSIGLPNPPRSASASILNRSKGLVLAPLTQNTSLSASLPKTYNTLPGDDSNSSFREGYVSSLGMIPQQSTLVSPAALRRRNSVFDLSNNNNSYSRSHSNSSSARAGGPKQTSTSIRRAQLAAEKTEALRKKKQELQLFVNQSLALSGSAEASQLRTGLNLGNASNLSGALSSAPSSTNTNERQNSSIHSQSYSRASSPKNTKPHSSKAQTNSSSHEIDAYRAVMEGAMRKLRSELDESLQKCDRLQKQLDSTRASASNAAVELKAEKVRSAALEERLAQTELKVKELEANITSISVSSSHLPGNGAAKNKLVNVAARQTLETRRLEAEVARLKAELQREKELSREKERGRELERTKLASAARNRSGSRSSTYLPNTSNSRSITAASNPEPIPDSTYIAHDSAINVSNENRIRDPNPDTIATSLADSNIEKNVDFIDTDALVGALVNKIESMLQMEANSGNTASVAAGNLANSDTSPLESPVNNELNNENEVSPVSSFNPLETDNQSSEELLMMLLQQGKHNSNNGKGVESSTAMSNSSKSKKNRGPVLEKYSTIVHNTSQVVRRK